MESLRAQALLAKEKADEAYRRQMAAKDKGEFIVGETNFEIEKGKSHFDVRKTEDGRLLLTIEVRGNENVYKEATAKEDSEWAWTQNPPYFYLRDYPVSLKAVATTQHLQLKPEDSDNYDLALYWNEHNDVDNVEIDVDLHQLKVTGQVNLMGKPSDFRIVWLK